MNTAILLARFWGVVLLAISLAFLVNRKFYMKMIRALNNDVYIFLSGFVALAVGLYHIFLFNLWVNDWRLIITLFGWAMVLKGLVRLFRPQISRGVIKTVAKSSMLISIMLLIALGLGAYLTYLGFA